MTRSHLIIILGTVSSTVIDFAGGFEKVAIYAQGSTSARTRLYQMGLNAYREEIEAHFSIMGYKQNALKEGVNYEAFLETCQK